MIILEGTVGSGGCREHFLKGGPVEIVWEPLTQAIFTDVNDHRKFGRDKITKLENMYLSTVH